MTNQDLGEFLVGLLSDFDRQSISKLLSDPAYAHNKGVFFQPAETPLVDEDGYWAQAAIRVEVIISPGLYRPGVV